MTSAQGSDVEARPALGREDRCRAGWGGVYGYDRGDLRGAAGGFFEGAVVGVGVKRVLAAVGAGAVLAGVLAGCAGGVSEAEACERGYTAIERMSAASGAGTTTEAGLEQVFTVNDGVVDDLRAVGASGELAKAHEALAVAIEGFSAAGRARMAGTGSEGAVDAASVKVIDASSRVDAICGG